MQKDLISKIDLLVEMSGTTNSFETSNEELILIEKKIENQKSKIDILKKNVANNDYVKASDRIIDENIKLGLENRIKAYEEELESKKMQISQLLKDEDTKHGIVIEAENELNILTEFLNSLDMKLKSTIKGNKENYAFYQKLINKTHEDIDKQNEFLKKIKKEYQNICNELDQLNREREKIEEQLVKEKERLNEIVGCLANPNSYVNKNAKMNDEKAIDKMTDELEDMEHRRLEIITDPAFIAQEIKKFLREEDFTAALDKINELVTIVLTKSYMDVDNSELDDLLEKATAKRDAFATEMESKDYLDNSFSICEMRLDYLKKRKQEISDEINDLKKKIESIDSNLVKKLIDIVSNIKDYKQQLEGNIEEYIKVINTNKEFKTPKKEASLRAALKKKEEELSLVKEILLDFEKDLENTVIESKKLEEFELNELESKLKVIDDEIKTLNKNQLFMTKSKDILAAEKDKEKLKNLDDDVQAIINRKKYSQKPNEILDELELSLGTINKKEVKEEAKNNDFVNLEDYRIDLNKENEQPKEEEKVEETKEKSVIPDSISLEKTDSVDDFLPDISLPEAVIDEKPVVEPVIDKDLVKSFESKEETNKEENKDEEWLKVIKVEPINNSDSVDEVEFLDTDEEKKSSDDDDDYISFNNILEGDDNIEN